ncbi:2',3'-cyclic-nucleotide 2'-phosphodiesterase [Caldibacillus debilis]|uniref:2',3'-cyclic-nucleotide 2'-phosphodiesterase n=2 Tax=Caldibacillus debilis TaxID=301148 RepID=A0A150LDM5_9BACI|nr:2',3'-cyclic-nucleotide 2'-phosphodiesterase [Caldibacillus debilis]
MPVHISLNGLFKEGRLKGGALSPSLQIGKGAETMERETETTLTVLETSDVHGHIFPVNYGTNAYAGLGMAKIATLVKEIRRKEKNVLLIDNGDNIQGTPLTYHYVKFMSGEMNPVVKVMNHLRYDAAVVGNHEFNYGMEVLERAVGQSDFPWLSANLLDKGTGEPYFGKPYIIKLFEGGLKVAVLGLTTHYIPNWEKPEHIRSLRFEDTVESAKRWVKKIRAEEKPDVLVLSYHGGFERDPDTGAPDEAETGENVAYRLCMEVEGIDCLLTGHQHRKIWGKTVNGVVVLQPGCNGQYLGKATIRLKKAEGRWTIIGKRSELLPLENVPEDREVIRLCEKYEEATQKWLDRPIGRIEGDMTIKDPFEARVKEHPFIELINRVQMEASGADISGTALFHDEVKGFRHEVTMRDIVSSYVYPNTLVVVKITGKDLKAALERSASYFCLNEKGELAINPAFSHPKPQHYNYDMWEGIEYVIDVSKPVGERVVRLTYKNQKVEDDQELLVVINNYRASGGGEYTMFKNREVVREIQTDMTELLANYFLEKKTVKAVCNHNWEVRTGDGEGLHPENRI